jgi:hypothetical protein
MKHYINSQMKYTAVALACLLIVVSSLLGNTQPALATGTGPLLPPLLTAGNYTILTMAGISNTVTALTLITGDIGVSPIHATGITGFGLSSPPTTFTTSPWVTGKVYASDYATPTPANLTAAILDMTNAYTNTANMLVPAATLDEGAGHLGGKSLVGGIYKFDSSDPNVDITSTLTLTGGAGDTWIFQIPGNLTIATNQHIVMGGSAVPQNVYWQVAGSTTISPGATFQGVILDYTNIAIQTGATLIGRAFSQTAVTLDANTITVPVQSATSATGVTINSPTSGTPAYNHQGGQVQISYNLAGSGGDSNAVQISVTNGVTTIATVSIGQASGATYTPYISINNPAPAGTYNLIVADGNGHQATSTNCIIINNTAPIIPAPTSPPSTGGWSSNSTSVHNPLAFAISSVSTTATVTVGLGVNSSTSFVTINSSLVNPITGPITYYSGYLAPSGSGPLVVGTVGQFWLQITATDSYLNTTQITYGPYTLVTAGPQSYVNPAMGPGYTSGQIFNTAAAGPPISGSISTPTGAGQYEIGLFDFNVSSSNPAVLLTGGWQTAVNGTYGTWSGNTFAINYPWTVPSTIMSSNCYIGIQGKDSMGNVGNWAFSANAFRIFDNIKPTVTILWPTSGSVHYAGFASDNVTWTQTDNIPNKNLNATIWLSLDGGNTIYTYIAAIPQPQGTAYTTWSVPVLTSSSTNCVITENISDTENPANITTVRSGTFSIVAPQVPTVSSITSPACGVTWAIGSTQTLTWTQNDTSSSSARLTDNITISADGGTNWFSIAVLPNMPLNQNSQSISVPDPHALYGSWTTSNGNYSVILQITATNTSSGQSGSYTMPCSFTITNTGVFPVQTSQLITLYPGWNLVSLPLVPTNSSLQNVLGNALPNITAIWTCSGGGTTGGTWSSWSPGLSYGLTTIVDGKAYWINTNLTSGQTVQFSFQGRVGNPPPSAPPSYSYPAGWNMVGFTSTQAELISSYLGTVNTTSANYNLPIIGYNANPTPGPVGFTPISSGNMNPGFGYWVFYNTQGTANASMR